MSVYKITARQIYYVQAENADDAKIHFIEEDENVGFGFTEITDVEEVQDDE